MTDYVKRFTDRVQDVPVQLRRRLALLRSLDEQVANLQKEIEEHMRKSIAEKGKGGGQPNKKQKVQQSKEESVPEYDLHSAVTRLSSLAEEKVNIANQIYIFIDKHINHLDNDLQELDAAIEAERKELGLEDEETACGKLNLKNSKGADRKGKRRAAAAAASAIAEEALPSPAGGVSDSEPLYCICQKPSAGQMVGCDNDDCPIEWFHFDCVGLTSEPQGEWHCPVCRGELNWQQPTKMVKRGK